jgi:hypothetical protein
MRNNAIFVTFGLQCIMGVATAYYYYTTNGGFTNTCQTQTCLVCNTIGQYKQNCGANSHTDPGTCVSCTGLPTGGQWTTHGYFDNSCDFKCVDGYFKNNSLCYIAMSKVTLASVVEVPLQVEEFNQTAFIIALAQASNCSTCTSPYTNPAICGSCEININSITKKGLRRLLTFSFMVNFSIDIVMSTTDAVKLETTTPPDTLATNIATELSNQLETAPITVTSATVTVAESPPFLPPQPTTNTAVLTTSTAVVTTHSITTAIASTSKIPTTTTKLTSSTTSPSTTTTKLTSSTASPSTTRTQLATTSMPPPTISSTTRWVTTSSTATASVINTTKLTTTTTTTTTQIPLSPSLPSTTAASGSSVDSNLGIIIGAAAGGGVFLIALISLLVYFLSGNTDIPIPALETDASAEQGILYFNQHGAPALRLSVEPPVYRLY